jgi:O-antigen/teichoic acid export membrane protein
VRLGQTSAIHFASEVLASLAGFVATLYIARELGDATLGRYAVFMGLLLWLNAGTGQGIQQAVKKRISEHGGGARELGAGIIVQAGAFVAVSLAVVVLAGPVNGYLGFDGAGLLVVALGTLFAFSLVRATLEGEQKVHIAALVRPFDRLVRSGVQLAVIFLGILGGGLVGLVWGYVAGAVAATLAGLVFMALVPDWPRREHIERVVGFARYAWLSGIEGRSLSSMDTVVLAAFVADARIGHYEVAWNLASILAVFATSISDTLYPTLSRLSSEDVNEAVSSLIDDALAYTGLFIVPGLVGAVVVGDRVLGIYGSEFTEASVVLVILVMARLIYSYESQLVATLNAIDRPQVAFRVNVVFVVANLGLNVLFVWWYGWTGAAVATTLASAIGLVLAYYSLASVATFEVPVWELARQWLAAGVMGVVVHAVSPLVGRSLYATALTVVVGALLYFVVLFGLSHRFRATVRDNLPEVSV